MKRLALQTLMEWKTDKHRKPLIIRGARQVGKTWLMKEFGRTSFKSTVYVNFDNNPKMKQLFDVDLDIGRIITGLELYSMQKIDPETTLLIFDEVQEVPRALTSLKYFDENAPQYHIVCAGSLLGVTLHQGTSFPVGKVDFLELYPLSFEEFMIACGNERYIDVVKQGDFEVATVFKELYTLQLKYYYYVGGMPEVVSSFIEENDFNKVRRIQKRILQTYEQDFSKHAPLEVVPRINAIWHSLPSQLAKENKKFLYSLVRDGARAREMEMALMWLIDCGLIHKVPRVTAPHLPLIAFEDLKAFKLYVLDVGLLSCMTQLEQATLIDGNVLFSEFKGALTEQYVLQQLKFMGDIPIYYYKNDSTNTEIDFLTSSNGSVVPIEVKAECNLQAKSLKMYRQKYAPPLSVRISLADYKKEEGLLNLPLYMVFNFKNEIKIR